MSRRDLIRTAGATLGILVPPVVLHPGVDPVWFGIFRVIVMECALITPPVGMELHVVQGMRARGELADVHRRILPLVPVMMLMVMPELLY